MGVASVSRRSSTTRRGRFGLLGESVRASHAMRIDDREDERILLGRLQVAF